MRTVLRAIVSGVLATIASILTGNVGSALAQTDEAYLIKATPLYQYARYYSPYAIQAAAAYLPVDQLNETRTKIDDKGYGADVTYATQNIFGDEVITPRAKQALKAWQYQFGKDEYLTCVDPNDGDCQNDFRNRGWAFSAGPSFQVWARTHFPHTGREVCTEVSIAFRGTVGGSSDWFSNFDRFGSPYDDYYHQLRRNVNGIISLIKGLDCYKRAKFKPQIVSLGHSLGGGLAQLAALAVKPGSPRITKVFAFDPSPVTGARLVKADILEANRTGLTIDRIYQQGEVLSYPRAIAQEYPPSSSRCNPHVRTVGVDAVSPGGPVHLHGMQALAGQVVQASYDGETLLAYRAPPSPREAQCHIRYQPPPTDEDNVLVSARAGRTLSASANNYGGYADQLGASYAYMQQNDPTASLGKPKIRRVAMSGGRKSRNIPTTYSR
jgi:pimeloyl-ACP methyl ester carboxylesterase